MMTRRLGAAAALVLLAAGPAGAATLHFKAQLKGSQEVPPTTSKGTGEIDAALDTESKMLTYTATYSGLTGPVTAAHFHGPAAPGKNAPPVVPVKDLSNPMQGTAALTDAQIGDLRAGMWYFNIHTAAYPGGEIRGQVKSAP